MESVTSLPDGVFRLRPRTAHSPATFPFGLGASGVHEVCEAAYGDMAALTGFVLAAGARQPGAIAWVAETKQARAHGGVLAGGLPALRADPAPLLHIEAHKHESALWAVEEAISSAAVGLVVADLAGMDFTASRRLTLAANRHGVPVILLLPYTCEGSTAAASRWRVSPRPSTPNRFDPRAPGAPRWRAVLERCRTAPDRTGQIFDIELNDETLSLHLAAGLAADAPDTGAEGQDERRRA